MKLVARYADVLQIGARNMQNYRLLEAVGGGGQAGALEVRPGGEASTNRRLRRNTFSTSGNPSAMLCERGIRTFETHTRFSLDFNIGARISTTARTCR